jgi:hypothetical protein
VIKNVWQNTDIAREDDPRRLLNCQSCCYGILLLCTFVLGLNSLFNEICLLFVSLPFWNQEMFAFDFWQNNFIKLQHVKLMLINPERLKVFWLQKWLDVH